jgi:hypothetical protein
MVSPLWYIGRVRFPTGALIYRKERQVDYCKCMGVRKGKDAWMDIWDELKEFVEEPSKDEFSDIMFGIGRLVAGFVGKVYVRMPFDGLHVDKINARMAKQGCVRSERAVREGDGCI